MCRPDGRDCGVTCGLSLSWTQSAQSTTLDGPPHCFTEDGAAVIQARRMIEYVVMHALEELDVPLDLVHRHRELLSSRHFRCGLGRAATVLFSWCEKWWCFLLDYNLYYSNSRRHVDSACALYRDARSGSEKGLVQHQSQ